MTDFQPTHKHKVTGQKLQRITIDGVDITEMTRIKTVHGFYYWVDTDMLEPLALTEKWENVQSDSSFVKDGAINVYLPQLKEHVEYPHPDVRLVDGKILQRRTR